MNFRLDEFSPDPVASSTLDRLVDGSLPEADRRALLRRLDSETDGWRRCALAFLEAQTWREALAPLAAAAVPLPAQSNPPVAPSRSRFPRRAVLWFGLAASLLAAFLLGRTLGRDQAPAMPHDLARETAPVPATQTRPSLPEAMAVAEDKQAVPNPLESNPHLQAVVKSLQQQGFSAECQTTHVTMTLPDGSERKIPAQEIRLLYVGNRTY